MNCPICKKPVAARDDRSRANPHDPFCSERCKLIDLGRWLDGKYQIPVADDPAERDAGETDGEEGDEK